MTLAQNHSRNFIDLGQTDSCSATDPIIVAKSAGLRYVNDTLPGIKRKKAGRHFSYIDLDNKLIHDPDRLKRIKSLGIPPAWKNVWICPEPQGHLQATGYDAKGRKQYRYHPHWREVRDATKYEHIVIFGENLPDIRNRVAHDLALQGLPREKVLATIVDLLDTTMIRVGNEEYSRENHSFGLTTLHNRHVAVSGSKVHFHFRGKSGKEHSIDVHDKQLAKIVRRCQELPGYKLFEYYDEDDTLSTVDSSDVNAYIHEISQHDFTAKDFRTWGGTVIVMRSLLDSGAFENQTQARKNVVEAIKTASEALGNTPAICRKCYVHPGIIDAYMDTSLLEFFQKHQDERKKIPGLHEDEANVLAFLGDREKQVVTSLSKEKKTHK